ncbi:hypothetical protein LAZ67_8000673 [Cordylochernes scorpioides]|uniref:Uncharacterized protein n=1 Tax=Cordylochernes scorpioides TaxID=51811 RepID=A0ABY6KUM6_9ARAC|nr:hypothetical protein LAZ67_8000673 [Cordylochernes scorpioides]
MILGTTDCTRGTGLDNHAVRLCMYKCARAPFDYLRLLVGTGHFEGMKINPDMTRSYSNCNNCHNTQLTPDHIYPAILAALYMADNNPEEDIHTNTFVGWYCDLGAWTDLICSMDKTSPPYIKRNILELEIISSYYLLHLKPFSIIRSSSDLSLAYRYQSCSSVRPLIREAISIIGRPSDLQSWIFAEDLEFHASNIFSGTTLCLSLPCAEEVDYVVRANRFLHSRLEAETVEADYPSLPELGRALRVRLHRSGVSYDRGTLSRESLRHTVFNSFRESLGSSTYNPVAIAGFLEGATERTTLENTVCHKRKRLVGIACPVSVELEVLCENPRLQVRRPPDDRDRLSDERADGAVGLKAVGQRQIAGATDDGEMLARRPAMIIMAEAIVGHENMWDRTCLVTAEVIKVERRPIFPEQDRSFHRGKESVTDGLQEFFPQSGWAEVLAGVIRLKTKMVL